MTMTRRRLLDDTFKKSVVGNPAIATDSLARMYPGIEMQGWTEQDGTPTPENPVPIVSAGIQNQDTGKWEYEVVVGCGQLFDISQVDTVPGLVNNGDGTLSVTTSANDSGVDSGKSLRELCPGITQGTYYLQGDSTGSNKFIYIERILYFGSEVELTGYDLEQEVRFYASGVETSAVVSKIMLNASSTPLPYTPYLPPQTVTLTADRPLTKWDKLTKRDGVWGWVYKSDEIVLDGSEDERWSHIEDGTASRVYTNYDTNGDGLCNKYVYGNAMNPGQFDLERSVGARYIRFNCYGIASDVGSWRTWISENPLTVLYQTTEETFVPLSQAEQEQMNTLHTNRPTTVLSNQQGCQMALTYKTRKSMEVTA